MADATKGPAPTRSTLDALTLPGWVKRGPWVLLVIGASFYGWILATRPEKASFWGVMGDTVAPFATLFNVLALFAVLRSIQIQSQGLAEQRTALELQRKELRLQRRELRLQRQEFKDSREVMKEQKEQFERTAKAQEDLAKSQALLATAQVNANREAAALRLAQHSSTIATMDAALATLDSAAIIANAVRPLPPDGHSSAGAERRQAIGNRIDLELRWEASLRHLIATSNRDD